MLQGVARWRPAPRERIGPAITPTVPRRPRPERVLVGGLAAALFFAAGWLLSSRWHRH